MIIFGWGRRTRRDLGAAFYNDCPNCHNRTFFHYIAVRVWITLFFIPVFPYKRIEAYVCRVCQWGFPINGQAERDEAMRRVAVTLRWAHKELTDAEYREALVTASVPQAAAPAPQAEASAASPPSPQAESPPPTPPPQSPPPATP